MAVGLVLALATVLFAPGPFGAPEVLAAEADFAENDEIEMEEDTSVEVPVLANEIRTNLPEIAYSGENVAWDGSGPYLITVGGTDFYAFQNTGDGTGTATAHTGWDSLTGVAPSDVTFAWDDLELDSVTHSAPWVYEVFAERDGVGPFNWTVAGATAAEGTMDIINVVIDDSGTSTQGAATAYGQMTFTGPVGEPFYEEIRDRSCGTGVMWFETDSFVPTVFADPETYQATGGMYPTGYQVVAVEGARHGQVTINPDGTTVQYTPDAGFDGPDSFTYTAQDCDGNTSTATVNVTVTGDDDPVDLSLQATADGLEATFTGHAADPECRLTGAHVLVLAPEGGYIFAADPGLVCSVDLVQLHTYSAPGTYTACWDVVEEGDVRHEVCTDVTVVGNGPPAAGFMVSDLTPPSLTDVVFTDTSTADAGVVSWAWDFGDGATSASADPVHAFAAPGVHVVCLTITDGDGLTDTACRSVNVLNRLPTVSFTHDPVAPVQGTSVAFDATATDDDGTIVGYAWDFGDGAGASAADPSHVYADDGIYTACVTVTDDWGDDATACTNVTVINLPPVADYAWLPDVPTNLDDVAFSDLSHDPDGTVVSWSWDFGDGNTSATPDAVHRYARGGTYEVTLTVTDDDGATTTDTRTIEVLPVLSKGRAQGIVQGAGFATFADTGDVVEEFDAMHRVKDTLYPLGPVSVLDAWAQVDTYLGDVAAAATVEAVAVSTPAGTLHIQQVFTLVTNSCVDDMRSSVQVGGITLDGISVLPAQDMAEGTVVSLPGGVELSFHVHTLDAEGRDRVAGMVLTAPGVGTYEFAVAAAGMENCPAWSELGQFAFAVDVAA